MTLNKFINIDGSFYINDNLLPKYSNACISFIANQKKINKLIIEKKFKKKKSHNIFLSKIFIKKGVDIAIKRNFFNSFKCINLKKLIFFYECEEEEAKLYLNKINYYKLYNIKFFPKTKFIGACIFQKLAKGSTFIPKNYSDFDELFFKNIFLVFNTLSKLNKNKISIQNYIAKNDFHCKKNDLFNSKIINKIFILLKRFKQKNIITSLTHGDFKLNHLFLLNNNLECVVDWEDVGERSIFYDLLNFFVPWFLKRSYNYFQIKNHICQLVKIYSPNLSNEVSKKYDLYFLLFSLERYNRIKNKNFNEKAAFKRYNILFNNLIKRLNP